MACIVHILRNREMDIALSYLFSTILIDRQLSIELHKCMDFRQLSNSIRNQGLISRKLDSFGPYFINAMIILKQSNIITISEGILRLIDQSLDRLFDMCKNLSTEEIYNDLNVLL